MSRVDLAGIVVVGFLVCGLIIAGAIRMVTDIRADYLLETRARRRVQPPCKIVERQDMWRVEHATECGCVAEGGK